MSRRYVASVANAFKIGYKLLDFSAAYGNMNLIGKAIRVSGVDRKDLFITTRVSNKAQRDHTVREEFLKGIKEMGVDYVDLLQFHCKHSASCVFFSPLFLPTFVASL